MTEAISTPTLRPPFQGLMGRQPTNLETGQTSAIWPSRGRCETSIFPNLKRLIWGSFFMTSQTISMCCLSRRDQLPVPNLRSLISNYIFVDNFLFLFLNKASLCNVKRNWSSSTFRGSSALCAGIFDTVQARPSVPRPGRDLEVLRRVRFNRFF